MSPTPGVIATSQPAQIPKIKHPKANAILVATKPAAKSILASDKIAGLTAIMKETVKNVLISAIISVLKFVYIFSSLKI